jgi:murein DD-endopeptidase MepM/ murein hydrolase activator NlpD
MQMSVKNCAILLWVLTLLLVVTAGVALAHPNDWKAPWWSNVRLKVNGGSHGINGSVAFDFIPSTMLYSPAAGIVECANGDWKQGDGRWTVHCGNPSSHAGFGNHVAIRTEGEKLTIMLAHLKEGSVKVKTGDSVQIGTPLGEIGNTGNVEGITGIHLHFEILKYPYNAWFNENLGMFGYKPGEFKSGNYIWGGISSTASPPPSPPSPPSPPDPPYGLVEFYNASAGRTSGTGPGEWNVPLYTVGNARTASQMNFPNDELSSFRINDDRVVVELYADDNYDGERREYRGKDFFNLS